MTICEAFILLMWDCFVPRNDGNALIGTSLRGTKQSHHRSVNTFDSYSVAYPESSGSLVGTKPRVLGVN